MGNVDVLEGDQIHDNYRIDYLRSHIQQMKEAVAEDVYKRQMQMNIT